MSVIIVVQWASISTFARKRYWFFRPPYKIYHTHAGWLIPSACLKLDHDKAESGIGFAVVGFQVSILKVHRLTDDEFDALERAQECPF